MPKPLYQSSPAEPGQGPSAVVAPPLPGHDLTQTFEYQSSREVRDDTHSVFNMISKSAGRFGRGINVNIADFIDAPAEIVNFILSGKAFPPPPEGQEGKEGAKERVPGIEPFSEASSFRNFFEALGIGPGPGEEDPPSIEKSAGELVGAGATILLPFGRAAKGVTQVVRGQRAAPTTIAGRTVHQMAQHAIDNPKSFLAIEAAAGATGGAAGFVVEQKFPNSPTAKVMAEMAGAITPAGLVGVTKLAFTTVGARVARNFIQSFGKEAGKGRAEKRLTTLARDKDLAASELAADDALGGTALTPAQATGDEGLLSLEKAVIDSSEQLKAQADLQIANATNVLRESLAQVGRGVPVKRTVDTLRAARDHLNSLLDMRMRIAARKADELIADLAPGATRSEANLIVEKEVEDALEAANFQLAQLFDAVPDTTKVTAKPLKKKWEKRLKKTPLAQREDLPGIAARLLGKEKDAVDPEFQEAFAAAGLVDDEALGRFADKVSIRELQGLRSKLLEDARAARASGKFNAARLASATADDVLEAMGATRDAVRGEVGEQLRLALDFAADIKKRFNTGFVRKLLRPDPQGGEFIPGALILEQSVGKGGPRARLESDQLQAAVAETGDQPALRSAIEDFLLDDFERRVTRGGLTLAKAENFFKRHQDVLDDFPELNARLEAATEAEATSIATGTRAKAVSVIARDPRKSRAAVFLKEPAEDGIARAAKLPESEAGAVMATLVRKAGKDTTGDALKGLKTSFGEFLLDKSSSAKTTIEGEFIVNGSVLKRLLEKPGPVKAMAQNLFDGGELSRLDIIAKTALKVEKATKATAQKGILADTQSILFSTMLGVGGAFVGRKLGTGTIQAPAFIANLFRRIGAKLTQDPAKKLIIDAQQDAELFEALLHPVDDIPLSARRQINAWAAGILKEELTLEGELPPDAELVGPQGEAEDTGIAAASALGAEDTGVPTTGERPRVQNEDGSVSSELSITVTDPAINEGKPTNIPSMFEGVKRPQEEAIRRIVEAGGKDPETGRELPAFDTIEEAVAAAQERSDSLLSSEGVTPDVIDALATIESGNDPAAVSPAGAIGTFQIIPATAADPGFGVTPIDLATASEEEQRQFATEFLTAMLDKFGTLELALAAYNAGPGAVERVKGDVSKLPKETRDYLEKFRKAGVLKKKSLLQKVRDKITGGDRT